MEDGRSCRIATLGRPLTLFAGTTIRFAHWDELTRKGTMDEGRPSRPWRDWDEGRGKDRGTIAFGSEEGRPSQNVRLGRIKAAFPP